MRPLSASDLLSIWESGVGGTPVEQALAMLKAACPQANDAKLSRLTVGQRDAYLLRVRELTFGPQLKGLANCPICHEHLELEFDVYDLLTPSAALHPANFAGQVAGPTAALPDPETLEPLNPESSFCLQAYAVTYRLPTSADLMTLTELADAALARQQLLQTCVTSVRRNGVMAAASDLPTEVLQALIEHMGEADPLANLTLSTNCPACGHTWPIIFDIVSYFWSEINAWAMRLIREVHALASAYGWPEADILAMSAWRRQRYLELIGR